MREEPTILFIQDDWLYVGLFQKRIGKISRLVNWWARFRFEEDSELIHELVRIEWFLA